MNHTPGPWEAEPTPSIGPQYVIRPEAAGPDIAIVYDHGETEANARLIAAAPDLLAALKAVYRVAKDAFLPGPVYLSISERNQIEAAIVAATGEERS